MAIMRKLNTLFRASAREAAEQVVDANAVRIYEQEIIDAETVLAQRRRVMAAMIANRRELELEIEQQRETIARRECELGRLPQAERSDSLLQLAAGEIADAEEQLARLEAERAALCDGLRQLESTLRGLIREIRQHRRDLKTLRNRGRLHRHHGAACTLNERMLSLRETRASLGGQLDARDHLEAGVEEAARRLDGDPLREKLEEAGASERSLHVARVLERLRGAPAKE